MEQFPNELSFECLASSRHLSYQGPHFTNAEWHIWPGTCTVWISWQSLCFCFPLFYLVLEISAVFRKYHTQVSQTLHFFKLYTVDHEDLHFFLPVSVYHYFARVQFDFYPIWWGYETHCCCLPSDMLLKKKVTSLSPSDGHGRVMLIKYISHYFPCTC